MTTATFTVKSNAVRAARKALGAEAVPGADFHLVSTNGLWAWVAGAEPASAPAKARKETLAEREDRTEALMAASCRDAMVSDAAAVRKVEVAALPAPPAPVRETEKAAKRRKAAGGEAPVANKATTLVQLASRPQGVTMDEIKALTGWTKFGGFYDALKRAGLKAKSEKVDGVLTYKAVAAG